MSAGNDREFIDHLQNKEGKEQAMKCPLMLMTWHPTEEMKNFEPMNCQKEECAWWDEPMKRCLWQNVCEKLSFLYLELTEIREKMPHAD